MQLRMGAFALCEPLGQQTTRVLGWWWLDGAVPRSWSQVGVGSAAAMLGKVQQRFVSGEKWTGVNNSPSSSVRRLQNKSRLVSVLYQVVFYMER